MLEMAILEIQIFKTLWGSMPPDPPRKLTPSAPFCAPFLLEILDSPPAPGLDLYPEMFGGIKGSPSFWGGRGRGRGGFVVGLSKNKMSLALTQNTKSTMC